MRASILFPLVGWLRGLRVLLLAGCGAPLLAHGEFALTEGKISEFDQKRALEMMQSKDAGSRALAYRACRNLGDEGKAAYRALLQSALDFHQAEIEGSIDLATEEANRFSGTLEKLRQQRDFALDFTLAGIEGDHSAFADLRRAHSDAALWFKESRALHGRATASMGAINSSSTAIDEIRREYGYCSGKAVVISQRTFERVLSKYSTVASNLHDRLAEMSAFHQEAQRYQKSMQHNRAQTWATTEMRAFADILNEKRHTLGLGALRLEKCLSAACAGHSKEMVEKNYFAHRSPVTEHATPDKRAAKAKYQGTFVGENIYLYASPQNARAVFDAWWKSDGHRFVMFDPKSDQVGLSNRPATHWTMMTGTAPVRTQLRSASVE